MRESGRTGDGCTHRGYHTVAMTTSGHWIQAIQDACSEQDPASSNQLITSLHYRLSAALVEAMGRNGGPNFHSWAVWGSRRAGVTIRQEDLDDAIANATKAGGFVGGAVGAGAGLLVRRWLPRMPNSVATGLGAAIGALSGGWTASRIAI